MNTEPVIETWRKFFSIIMFMQLFMLMTPVLACDAPEDRFCVDFYKGRNLEGTPFASSTAPYIKYNWANRSPVRGGPYDNFSVRWRGNFNFKEVPYEFRALADDGIRIMLDGQPIIDHWVEGSGMEHRIKVTPGAGAHLIEVTYFEATEKAHVAVDWQAIPEENVNVDSAPGSTSTMMADPKKLTSTTDDSAQVVVPAKMVPFEPEAIIRDSKKPPLGINLSSFSYWSPSVPFKDLLIQSGELEILKQGSNEPCAEHPSVDKNGYPKLLPSGCMFRIRSVFHILEDDFWPIDTPPYQPGHYVLLYQGHGKVHLNWDAKHAVEKNQGRIEFDVPIPKDGIEINVIATDSENPVRNMHVVHVNDEASFQQQPFNERWLNLLRPFTTLRFVDWQQVNNKPQAYSDTATSHTTSTITLPNSAPKQNGAFDHMLALVNIDNQWPRVFIDHYDGTTRTLLLKTPIVTAKSGKQPTVYIFDFANRTWDQRAQPTTLGQTRSRGVAFELMIQLANTLNVNPWFNIPTAADDNFVQQLAELIKARLKPGLKCYIEYSNETWNTAFPGYDYSEAKGRELALTGTSPQADAWHAYRAIEIFKIFNRVFKEPDLRESRGQSRIVRILTSQTAWLDRAKQVMDWKMPGNEEPTQGNPAYKFADAWAVTTYFYLNGPKTLEQVNKDELIAQQIDDINNLFGIASKPGVIRQILAETKARGLQLIAYEGGTHVLAPQDRPDLITKVAVSNKDPRMKDVYTTLLNQWGRLYQEYGANTVGVWNHYADVGRYGRYGNWGTLQSTYQDPKTAPKYQALKNYVSGP